MILLFLYNSPNIPSGQNMQEGIVMKSTLQLLLVNYQVGYYG